MKFGNQFLPAGARRYCGIISIDIHSIDLEIFSGMSLTDSKKRTGLRIEPWGTPFFKEVVQINQMIDFLI